MGLSIVSLLASVRIMNSRPAHIHTHTKRGRMVETVEMVLRPFRRVLGAHRKTRGVPLNELNAEMLLDNDPPVTVELSEKQTEWVRELEEHGPAAR
jgi:hypothetical protein